MTRVIILVLSALMLLVYRRDSLYRPGVSLAVWIPTLWLAIIASRPVSAWFMSGEFPQSPEYSLEGTPLDRNCYLALILAALFVLARRGLDWKAIHQQNWPIVLFYGYLFISITWANVPPVSFKRWFKEMGNVWMALLILSEVNPQQAIRAVLVRSAYLLLPLSVILILYFPAIGRFYSVHSGEFAATGVTMQKNSLGALVLVCGLGVIWDWLERSHADAKMRKRQRDRHSPREIEPPLDAAVHIMMNRVEFYVPLAILGTGAWLLLMSDSKTSIFSLLLGAVILASIRLPVLKKRIRAFGSYAIAIVAGYFFLDWVLGIKEILVHLMGRDLTFTGRTDVWKALLDLHTNPIIGTGFCSFWSDNSYRSQLPEWVAFSAHNGYLETYLDGGVVAVFLLLLMLGTIASRVNRQLIAGDRFAPVRMAFLVVVCIANIAESHFGRMSPVGFMFLISGLTIPEKRRHMDYARLAYARS